MLDPQRGIPESDCLKRRLSIAQREIEMSCLGKVHLRDFAFHEQVAEKRVALGQ